MYASLGPTNHYFSSSWAPWKSLLCESISKGRPKPAYNFERSCDPSKKTCSTICWVDHPSKRNFVKLLTVIILSLPINACLINCICRYNDDVLV